MIIIDPRGTMYQTIAERGHEGLITNRLGIQSVPRVQIIIQVFTRHQKKILNYMNKVITDDKLIEMSKPSWFINYFLFSKEIMEKYAVLGMEAEIYQFFQKFRNYIDLNMDRTGVGADLDAIRFISDNRAGTNNKKSIISRFN